MTVARLAVHHLDKSYAAPVLKDVCLTIAAGEVHAIVGENGAGKTTLVNILAGLVQRDAGEIALDGAPYLPLEAKDAFAAGVSVAAQELATIDTLSVAENIGLRDLPARRGIIDRAALARTSRQALESLGLDDAIADLPVGSLPIADRQLVELARTLTPDARLLVFDEPTAALTAPQADRLHRLIRERAAAGAAVIYISHRLADVLAVADNVSVLRDGRLVLSQATASLDVDDLVAAMAGDLYRQRDAHSRHEGYGEPLLRVQSLTTADLPEPLSVTAHAGEIVGIAGLAGAGRSELLHAIFGLVRPTGGTVVRVIQGSEVAVSNASHAVRLGIALLGEDRQSMGLYRGQSLTTNMMIPGKREAASLLKLIDKKRESAAAAAMIGKLAIRCDGPRQAVDELSGGNQQKTLIARWLHRDSDVLLLDEPTRGVDVGTKARIYELLFEMRDNGKCIVLASSEIDELMAICDRILVMSGRRLVRTFWRDAFSEREILAAAFAAHTRDTPVH
ncbi:MAG: sugar ABC transporter ATP-binding protein [Woeseiaceae bacterium]|nr:sugar ABC transporter ATP-binding protein [Woeseiaceae bacterium]